MTIETKIEQLGATFEEYKSHNDARLEEIKTKGFETAETKAKMEKVDVELDGLKSSIEKLHAVANRKQTTSGKEGKEYSEFEIAHKEAFAKFARKGDQSGFEKKEMSVIVAEDGGFLVPDEMSSEIVKRVFDTSPIRDLASVQTVSSSSLEMLEDLGQIESGWVAERQSRPETDNAKLNMLIIPNHELYAQPAATQKLLDDASINVESWLAEKAGEKFSRDENTAFVNGNGEGKPRGFTTYADGNGIFGTIERIKSGVNGDFAAAPDQADQLIEIHGSLKGAYKQNAYWAMHRKTVAAIRKFKDNEGMYLWQPSLQAGTPDMFLNSPIREMDDLVAPSDFTTGSLAIALADFRAAYQIVDRKGVSVLRDPYTKKGFVLFYFTKRVGGAVKNYDAIKLFELSA